jgi:hypothetical protein
MIITGRFLSKWHSSAYGDERKISAAFSVEGI